MKVIKKIIAIILCMIMIIPVEGLTVFADTREWIEETLPLAELEEAERIIETLPLEIIDEKDDEWDGELVIYWNPGGDLPIATSSNAEQKNSTRWVSGKDSQDGLTPKRAVKTLAAALERAQQMQEDMEAELSEITICAMSPMEIADGQLYVLNGQHVNITSWEERAYDNDTIFYLNGGQLTLRNISLDSRKSKKNADASQLVWVDGGALQLGQNVEISGQVVMDYRMEKDEQEWQIATPSELATSSDARKVKEETAGFNIDDYILYEGDDYLEYIQDERSASTWKNPIIELVDGFEGMVSQYQILLYGSQDADQIEIVRSLYADNVSIEEFEEIFTLAEVNSEEWQLIGFCQKKASVRDTGASDLLRFRERDDMDTREADDLTVKALKASRESKPIYWNPGDGFNVGGINIPAGSDEGYDGTEPGVPVKSLGNAMSRAGVGGTIICMQGLRLEGDISQYLNYEGYQFIQGPNEYLIMTPDNYSTTIQQWESNLEAAFTVPDGVRLNLERITLAGLSGRSNRLVHSEAGGIIGIGKDVIANTGYIQIDATNRMRTEPPVRVTSGEGQEKVTLFFSGINEDLSYRYEDVVIPEGELAEGIDEDEDLAIAVGMWLNKKFQLERANRDDLNHGNSRFDWSLRPDTGEDTDGYNPQNLELYADYYYDEIYLDGVDGDDNALGASCHYPVKTWGRAVEIWKEEVERSVRKQETAKEEAEAEGIILTEDELNARYPIADVIYICNTVTIDNSVTAVEWDLEYIFKEKMYQAEVISHTHIPNKADNSGQMRHELPQVLFEVKDGKEITFKNLQIRNITNQKNTIDKKSITVLVSEGILNLDGSTTLTGERLAFEEEEAKSVTYGTHIYVDGTSRTAKLHLDENWNGSIQRRQHGVVAEGEQAFVLMDGGSIKENNSYDEAYSESSYNHEKGAGVVLRSGAFMEMNGGTISDNVVYQYGAGIYMDGMGTELKINQGTISKNRMARYSEYGTATNGNLRGYGIGVYAGTGTELQLGAEDSSEKQVQIIENKGHIVNGAGIYSAGKLEMNGVTVADNLSDQYVSSGGVSMGIGIHIAASGSLAMNNCLVRGNETKKSYSSENCHGAGIYLNSNTSHSIQNSVIEKNRVGLCYTTSSTYSAGGGIYISSGSLSIENTQINQNKAYFGGAIYAAGSGVTVLINQNTRISENLAHRGENTILDKDVAAPYGFGGGIYTSSSTLTITGGAEKDDWVQIEKNRATQGGGIYTASGTIRISCTRIDSNRSFYYSTSYYGNGGGWFSNSGTQYATNVEITNNSSSGNYGYGGGWFSANGIQEVVDTLIDGNRASASVSSGGGWYGTGTSRVKNTTISNNIGGSGGGWYSSGTCNVTQTLISDNTGTSGGGWYSSGTCYATETIISDNTGTSGGGWYNAGNSYVSDIVVTKNTATVNGGGIYSGSGLLHLSETSKGKTDISDNMAQSGGGIYQEFGTLNFDLGGEIRNHATEQGSNLYLASSGTCNILGGIFKQPEEHTTGIYNIYVNRTGGSQVLDLTKAVVEKGVEAPDVIFLNTGDSYLTYLTVPSEEEEVFPIDVNAEAFGIGSVVIKPVQNGSITMRKPAPTTGGWPTSYTSSSQSYTNMKATDNLDYSQGGIMPRRTYLGGFEVTDGTWNAVVVGEGIYLSSNGDDNNHGLTPDQPVATFKKAKENLRGQILLDKYKEGIGFSPFIYICGTVNIDENEEPWTLNPDDSLFVTDNSAYLEDEGENALPAQVRRFASFINAPMIKVEMGRMFEADEVLINGMMDAVITNDQGIKSPILRIEAGAEATLLGEAQVYNNYSSGIDLLGTLKLDGKKNEKNRQVRDHSLNCINMLSKDAKLEMKGYSRILLTGTASVGTNSRYGVYGSSGGTIEMKEYSQIDGQNEGNHKFERGIWMNASAAATNIEMSNEAQIINASSYAIFVSCGGTTPSMIQMKDAAKIDNSGYGIYFSTSSTDENCKSNGIYMDDQAMISLDSSTSSSVNVYLEGNGYKGIYMNTNEDAMTDDSAKLVRAFSAGGSGIQIAGGNTTIKMDKYAVIENMTRGVYLNSSVTTGQFVNVYMKGNSSIRKNSAGILLNNNIGIPMLIQLEDQAAIEGNSGSGIQSNSSTNYGWKRLELKLSGKSRISGNAGNGLSFSGRRSRPDEGDGIFIEMKGDSVIGGDGYYQSGDMRSGNYYAGISSRIPIDIVMEENSRISGNGNNGNNSTNQINTNAIYLYRDGSSIAGASHITLKGNASINGNKGSIYVPETTNATYPNICEITLDGSTGSYPVIENNTDGLWLGKETTLNLIGTTKIGSTTYLDSSRKRSIESYGNIELDGNSIIEGPIRLKNHEKPINMTNGVDTVDPLRQPYQLDLVEGFMGRPVVSPGGSLLSVTDQIDKFDKFYGEGLAQNKGLIPMEPNIVLQGENDVYLSGSGKDSNDGSSPSTSVRTFKRAKELLEGGENGGYYTDGANIIICGAVKIDSSADANWSFGPGGNVTNLKSNQTWKPLVIRHEGLLNAPMITVDKGAGMVVFENITIDGGSKDGIIYRSSGDDHRLLTVFSNAHLILGTGAVLQNNRVDYSTSSYCTSIGVYVEQGTLELNGGTIQELEKYSTGTQTSLYRSYQSGLAISSNGGTVIFNSGTIANNTWKSRLSGNSTNVGMIGLTNGSTMKMNGGTITNNYLEKSADLGSMIVVQNSVLEMSGGVISDNIGGKGSAVSYIGDSAEKNSCIVSGGQVLNNKNQFYNNAVYAPIQSYSPIYVNGTNFQLKGGGANLKDSIYLSSPANNIKISSNIYQNGRQYIVYLNEGKFATDFNKGSVVIQPDGSYIIDATPYMKYFEVHSETYILDYGQSDQRISGSNIIRENECLLLMKAVYLDGENGNNLRNASRPSQAVKTFEQAKIRGEEGYGGQDYYVIYLSGPAINQSANVTWSLPDTAYMCRYTGFEIYEKDGALVPEDAVERRAYSGSLLIPEQDLTLDGIRIYGRRKIDSIDKNGESLVQINAGVTVTIEENEKSKQTLLERNQNMGTYMTWPPEYPNGIQQNLSQKGGAVRVEPEGVLVIQGGTIRDTAAVYGNSVYLEADKTDEAKIGHFLLANSPEIDGSVYLSGTDSITAAYIQPDTSFKPKKLLRIEIGNDYHGRPVIHYRDNYVPGVEELKLYQFSDSIQAIYSIANRQGMADMLELEVRQVIYLDGKQGRDDNDGLTPETAFLTLNRVYEKLEDEDISGIVIYIVDTVEILSGESISLRNTLVRENGKQIYKGSYEDNAGHEVFINGQVYFKRYAQPSAYGEEGFRSGFNRPTLKDSLFMVKPGGTLELTGIYLDGHSKSVQGSDITLEAEGVLAEGPLVTVEGRDATLLCDNKGLSHIPNSQATATLFTNNINIYDKKFDEDRFLGTMGTGETVVRIYEGSSAAIEILDGAVCYLTGTQFANLELGNDVSGGTDVYVNGTLSFMQETRFTGSVFLEGLETYDPDPAAAYPTSRFLIAAEYGNPMATDFQVLMRDPYKGRKVVYYSQAHAVPPDLKIPRYRLEEVVKAYFQLNQRKSDLNVLELQIPEAVYIDGINGDDDSDNVAAGSTPENPVKSLKRAYELLERRGGFTIYIVNTVEIDGETTIAENRYLGEEGNIYLDSTDRIRLKRYVQPDFAREIQNSEPGYDVEDFQGTLLRVKQGATLNLGANVVIDGHRDKVVGDEYPKELTVTREDMTVTAPMIYVEEKGILNLNDGIILKDSNNVYEGVNVPAQSGNTVNNLHGGAIHNCGTTNINAAVFQNLDAKKGAGIYQDGSFTIYGGTENMKKFSVYLTTRNQGTEEEPVWGEDHYIRIGELLPDDMVLSDTFMVDMDHAVPGRAVVQFLDDTVYSPDADSEHEHFTLGSSVPEKYFLVERKSDSNVLELQDWNVFDVEVPTDIYLIVQRRGAFDSTTKLSAIRTDAAGDKLFSAPEYTITNRGRYEVAVSVRAFENENIKTGITHTPITLVPTATAALGDTDLYLAVKGQGDLTGDTTKGFTMTETSLDPYAETVVSATPVLMGTLGAEEAGKFTFVGAVGDGFVEKYLDSTFPLEGSSREEAQKYMDGRSTTSVVNARAKYALRYKLDIIPPRR